MAYLIERTKEFDEWVEKLKDLNAKARILTKLDRITNGNLGDHKSVGDGVSEIRIDYAGGYRLYFTIQGQILVILLCGGNKKSQNKDIEKAKNIKNNSV
jgi:putative addiction module killer protein